MGRKRAKHRVRRSTTTNNEFLKLAYCGLVLRGFNNAREIDDPILREVWMRGKSVLIGTKPEFSKGKR